ncbi:hypothetical protein QYF36_007047 [Acer negundo]|nr:hypothetical protein QYF36_007047 [Acer negundo]
MQLGFKLIFSYEDKVVSCSETIKSSVVEASLVKFVPSIRSGSYANIGTRDSMDDEHIQIDDLSAHLGSLFKCPTPSAFYAVFDGHGGPEAAAYIKKNAMKLFFEDAELPETSAIDDAFLQELENSHRRAFLLADLALADEHSCEDSVLKIKIENMEFSDEEEEEDGGEENGFEEDEDVRLDVNLSLAELEKKILHGFWLHDDKDVDLLFARMDIIFLKIQT